MFFRTIFTGVFALLLVTFPFMTMGNAMNDMPLHHAAKQNDAALVTRLLDEGAEIDARDDRGATALLTATISMRVHAVIWRFLR